ncbi:MAG: hypothetical protein H6622_04570 [Halobacteriovoraceae bacterium]|nr:hypothetical protein [Halobacteriovoraceae bacterium]
MNYFVLVFLSVFSMPSFSGYFSSFEGIFPKSNTFKDNDQKIQVYWKAQNLLLESQQKIDQEVEKMDQLREKLKVLSVKEGDLFEKFSEKGVSENLLKTLDKEIKNVSTDTNQIENILTEYLRGKGTNSNLKNTLAKHKALRDKLNEAKNEYENVDKERKFPEFLKTKAQSIMNAITNGNLSTRFLINDLDKLQDKLNIDRTLLEVFKQNAYKNLNKTAVGGYLTNQIQKAMGNICKLKNLCLAEDEDKKSPQTIGKILDYILNIGKDRRLKSILQTEDLIKLEILQDGQGKNLERIEIVK